MPLKREDLDGAERQMIADAAHGETDGKDENDKQGRRNRRERA
jgi:hypothetical protein